MKYLLIILLFTACNVTKGKQSKQSTSDSIHIRTGVINTGGIKTESGSELTTGKFEKVTVIQPTIIRDTIPGKPGQDRYFYTTTITEKGETATQSQYVNTDSTWKQDVQNTLMQLTKALEETSKSKKSELPTGFIIALCVLAGLVILLIIVIMYITMRFKKQVLQIIKPL